MGQQPCSRASFVEVGGTVEEMKRQVAGSQAGGLSERLRPKLSPKPQGHDVRTFP